ncbi:MAG TPA: AAA family ATPase [Lacipirellulaceae bacterium]|nr:AAA family ATPase [Lacipirellulaceae bacterium]
MPATALTLRQLAERDERTFPSFPQVARYFPASAIEEARKRVGRAIERGDGPGLIIGGPGTGKSLLLQVLAAKYHEQFDIVLPACARLCTRRALLQSILFELGLPYRSRDEGELRLSLLDHLLSKDECPSGLLLLVDEAQTLSVALLDELRVLTNLVRNGLPRVRLVLAGSSSLEESFADPELESFSQRLAARCYLGPFNSEETTRFVRAQLVASKAKPDEIFATDAWSAVFDATDGVPRLVNQLCDRALVVASGAGRARIDRKTIEAAWADIQQLPTPWDTPETTTYASHSPVVEFGNLAIDDASSLAKNSSAGACDSGVHEPASVPQMSGRTLQQAVDAIANEELLEFDTELDVDDELDVPTACGTAATSSTAAAKQFADASTRVISDPFAEPFDEEEVVLDNFAAWEDMFRRDRPRVANRRNPEFATMIAAAMDAAPAKDLRQKNRDANLSYEFDLRSVSGENDRDSAPDTAKLEADDRPTIRIADLSDVSAPQQADASVEEDPVLIIEDDSTVPPARKPPVRREEYRQLFSRLRSG